MHASQNSSPMDPRIGILCREGRTVFYAFVNGYHAPEFQGTRDEVEAALGLREAPVKAKPQTKRARQLNTYRACLTAPNGEISEYEVDAENKSEARAAIRKLYRTDTPAPRHGFLSFEQHRLEWIEVEG